MLLGRVEPVPHDHRRGGRAVGPLGFEEVRRQLAALERDRHPRGRRVHEVERLLHRVETLLVERDPLRVLRAQHPLGLADVDRRPEVLLPRRPQVPGRLGLARLLGHLVGDGLPRQHQVARARVAALGGVADRPARPVHLVDRATAVQRGRDPEAPDVVGREVLEHAPTVPARPRARNQRLVMRGIAQKGGGPRISMPPFSCGALPEAVEVRLACRPLERLARPEVEGLAGVRGLHAQHPRRLAQDEERVRDAARNHDEVAHAELEVVAGDVVAQPPFEDPEGLCDGVGVQRRHLPCVHLDLDDVQPARTDVPVRLPRPHAASEEPAFVPLPGATHHRGHSDLSVHETLLRGTCSTILKVPYHEARVNLLPRLRSDEPEAAHARPPAGRGPHADRRRRHPPRRGRRA